MNRHCPMCSGEGVALGSLGKTLWLRCRACGWTYTHVTPSKLKAAAKRAARTA